MKGNLLPPYQPLKDNDGGCVSVAVCTIMVLYGRNLNKIACGFCCLITEVKCDTVVKGRVQLICRG